MSNATDNTATTDATNRKPLVKTLYQRPDPATANEVSATESGNGGNVNGYSLTIDDIPATEPERTLFDDMRDKITNFVNSALPVINRPKSPTPATSTLKAIAERETQRDRLTKLLTDLLSTPYRLDIEIPEELSGFVNIFTELLQRHDGLVKDYAGLDSMLTRERKSFEDYVTAVREQEVNDSRERAEKFKQDEEHELFIGKLASQLARHGLLDMTLVKRTKLRITGQYTLTFERLDGAERWIVKFDSEKNKLTIESDRLNAIEVDIDTDGITGRGFVILVGTIFTNMMPPENSDMPKKPREEVYKTPKQSDPGAIDFGNPLEITQLLGRSIRSNRDKLRPKSSAFAGLTELLKEHGIGGLIG